MTRRTLVFCTVVLACAASAAGAQSRPVLSDQETLIQIERDWDAAFLRKDVAFIQTLLADEFIATYPDGTRGDRAKELALAAEFDQTIDSSTLDEFSVKVYRDTAVVLFTRRLVGPMQGVRTELTFRYMDVFVLREGRWQCVATQSTRVAD